jgi:hypothetical protein
MMNEDLHETLPLWSLDRRGDGPRGTATTREAVEVSSPRFARAVPLGDSLGMVAMRSRDGCRSAPRETILRRWR